MAYIRLDRGLRDHWIYQDSEYLKIWFEMIFLARFSDEPYTELIDGEIVTINYGEFMFGRVKWSQRLKVGEQRIRTLLNKLKKENMIELVSEHRKCSVYRLINYSKFNHDSNQQSDLVPQGKEDGANHQANQRLTISQPSPNQQLTTKEESNKEKNEKKGIKKQPPKNGRDDPTKLNYSDDVWLKPEQYEKLVSDHGEAGAKEMIEILNSYKVAKQEIYASDYHTMSGGGWVLKRYREEKKLTVITGGARNGKPRNGTERSDNIYDRLSL